MADEPNPTPSSRTRERSQLTSWIVIALVVVGGLVYLARQRQKVAMAVASNATGTPATMGGLMVADSVMGRAAPNWTLKGVTGETLSLEQFRGKPVVLDFWATWCGPCKIEIPFWNALQKQYAAQGLVIIGVSEDDYDQDVRNFLAKTRVDYPVVVDHDALAATWGMPMGLPTTFFIRRDGTIAARVEGLEGSDELEQRIQGIL